MTIIIESKELEHMLIFASTVAILVAICYLSKIFYQNNK